MKTLTKSKYLAGLESNAYLWTMVNDPEKIPLPDMATQDRFDEGHIVGELAKKLYPEGVDLSNLDFIENIEKTKEVVKKNKIIFEAGFMKDRCFARIDILIPNEEGFDLVEVKSSSKVKKIHYEDLAFQKHVAEMCSLVIKNVYVYHLNKEYERKGELIVENLFAKTDVTPEVNSIFEVDLRIKNMLKIIDLPSCPSFDFKDIPKSEYGNLFVDEFLTNLPEGNIFELYLIRKTKAVKLYEEGIQLIKDLPGNTKLNHKQQIQIKAQEQTYIDKKKIEEFVNGLQEPVIHMDFESYSEAVPSFDKVRPYQHLPFQYSIHIETKNGLDHKEFLYEGKEDPRKNFIENLIKDLPTKGSILVYHESYEVSKLKEIARDLPEYQEDIKKIILRIQDLKTPFSEFWYHDKKQKGSNSIKKVLPLFSKKTHKGLIIQNGSDAMIIYKKNKNKLTPELKKDLLDYCELDTKAMVIILKNLKNLVWLI